jgi:nucleotide-binding universal stress UspA family protein
MAMLERVLIPLDGSEQAESIIFALSAVWKNCESEVFLVRTLSHSPGEATSIRTRLQKAHDYLKQFEDHLLGSGVCAHAIVAIGSPTEVIESLAAAEEVTAIALATSHECWNADPPAGSWVGGMMRSSTKPVLTLRPGHVRSSARMRRADRPTPGVLVPLDRSEQSRQSLPLAVELAESLDAPIVLMRVLEQEVEKMEALRDLQEVAGRLNQLGRTAEIRIESGDPVARILQACREEELAFVVLTLRGSSGTSQRLFGNVAETVMNESPVPVLAIRATNEKGIGADLGASIPPS